jgi:hypothetical protein
LALSAIAFCTGAFAQAYPPSQSAWSCRSRPAAVPTSSPARCAEGRHANGWTFVIDNKPGAGGNLGVDAVAKSPRRLHIVLGQTSNLAINPTLYTKLPYDPVKDLTPSVCSRRRRS